MSTNRPSRLFLLSILCFLLSTFSQAADDPVPPYKRVLDSVQAKRVEDLQKELDSLTNAGKFTEAEKLADQVLQIRTTAQGKDHWETINAHYAVTEIQTVRKQSVSDQASYAKIGDVQKEAVALMEKGLNAQAQPLFARVLATIRKVLGEEHPVTAYSYAFMATNLDGQGKYEEARPLYEKALMISRKVLGEDHPDTASRCNDLGFNLNAQGRYLEARPLLEKALTILRKVLGEEHPDTAKAYNNLAVNLTDQEMYAQAAPLLEKSLAILRKQPGSEESIDMADSYSNVAANLEAQSKFEEARRYYEKALAIRLKKGEEHPEVALCYNNLASNLGDQEKHAEARPLYEKALAIYRKSLGEGHPDTAIAYNNLAFNLSRQQKYAEALQLHEKALAIRRKVLGESNTDTATSYANVAFIQDALGNSREAIALWQAATKASEGARLHVAGTGFERALFHRDQISPHASLASAFAELHQPTQAWQHLEAHLARGLLDDLDPKSLKAIEAPNRLAKLDELLIPLLIRADLSPEERTRRDALQEESAGLRQALSKAAAERSAQLIWPLEKIQSTLPADAAVVLWLDVRMDHWACVLRHSGPPIWERLLGTGAKKAWTDEDNKLAQRTYESALAHLGHPERDKLLTALRAQRLDSLLPHLQGIKHLLVVPTGEMAKVPLEALTDQFTVSYAPSASIYAQGCQRHRPLDGSSLLALGNPAFAPLTHKNIAPPSNWPILTTFLPPSPIQPLPGTKVEVEALAQLVPQTKLLFGSAASEQSLEQLTESGQLRNYRLLHLATHGQVNPALPTESALILAQDQVPDNLDDLLARTLSHKKPLDGRLTVGTILEKWQLDADQVVLSACETGLGTNAGGEGLLGFAQALLQKGARSVVLSRWKVPDGATSLLMQRYYQNILGKRDGLKAPMARAEGLREAKNWLRTLSQAEVDTKVANLPGGGELRSVQPALPVVGDKSSANSQPIDCPFAAPYYWAAFVLIGDPY